jgi:predicted nucleic acid-binding protein
VRLVVADTGPLNYLILIGRIGLLPILFEKVILPTTVRSELASSKAPAPIRDWVADLPPWLEVFGAPSEVEDASLEGIDAGEKAAILLAASLNADLLLMDDRKGVRAAIRKGLRVTPSPDRQGGTCPRSGCDRPLVSFPSDFVSGVSASIRFLTVAVPLNRHA